MPPGPKKLGPGGTASGPRLVSIPKRPVAVDSDGTTAITEIRHIGCAEVANPICLTSVAIPAISRAANKANKIDSPAYRVVRD